MANKAAQVAARISGNETPESLQQYFAQNPNTYLHVVKPHIHFGETKTSGEHHLQFAKEYLHQLLNQGVLVQDPQAGVYIYKQSLPDGHSFTGIIAGVSAIDYLEGTVKKHEYTLTEKENYMMAHLAHTHVVGEPVLLSCPDGDGLKSWIGNKTEGIPLLDFADESNTHHKVWHITDEAELGGIAAFMARQEALYIADGHHRIAASSDYLTRMHNEHNWKSNKMFFMAFIVPEDELWINSFHRLVKGLSESDIENMLSQCLDKFEVSKAQAPFTPQSKGEFGLCTSLGWYKLKFKNTANYGSPAQNLDVARLEQYIFKEILHITDSKSDSRLQFVRGDMPPLELENLVNKGSIDAAFLVYPNTMAEIKAVADAEETMPPKSTWIEPKMLTGMLIQKF